jgi:hypothetical protein
MDRSDEKNIFPFEVCAYLAGSIYCEERLCFRQQWSCGDGQCIMGSYRLSYKGNTRHYCQNMREFNYICEIHPEYQLWTQADGSCSNQRGYDDSLDMNDEDLNNASKCVYLIRCALSHGFERDCPCDRKNCSLVMADVCEADQVYSYPDEPLI